MNWKFFFAILGSAIFLVAYIPYFRDMFSRKTKPHAYTWLIWIITNSIAGLGVWYGGGRFGIIIFAFLFFMILAVFLFSLRYGTRNITRTDTFWLILALFAIVVWRQLHKPLLAVLMVTAIDVIGYFPTFRKSFHEPWSETVSSWVLFTVGNYLAILALDKYNLLTTTYLVAINFANIILVAICLARRRTVSKPKLSNQ